ncbi:MAG: glutamate ligase domain-containing protein, partial [Anaerolineales bacterium]
MHDTDDGVEMRDDKLFYRIGADSQEILDMSTVQLRGDHNKLNIMAACLAAIEIGVDTQTLQTVVNEFQGVPHRLEFVRKWKNASWYDDSIATTPERTLAAIQSFDEPLVLLLGGRDKDLPWNNLVDTIQNRVRLVVLFGEASELIFKALSIIPKESRNFAIQKCKSLHEAVLITSNLIIDGDVVLLSPGGTSFDEFRDFEERGERFKQWVQELS